MSPDSSGKPVGATHLQLFVAIGDGPPVGGANDARWIGQYTRNPIGVTFSPQDEGKRVTYDSWWISRRGEVGPWSSPVRMRIAG